MPSIYRMVFFNWLHQNMAKSRIKSLYWFFWVTDFKTSYPKILRTTSRICSFSWPHYYNWWERFAYSCVWACDRLAWGGQTPRESSALCGERCGGRRPDMSPPDGRIVGQGSINLEPLQLTDYFYIYLGVFPPLISSPDYHWLQYILFNFLYFLFY